MQSPLRKKKAKMYAMIFSDGSNQQEVNEDALAICKQLAIDPKSLKLK